MASPRPRWRAISNSRPRFHDVIVVNTKSPTASGTQPPAGTFTMFAEKKARSTTAKSAVSELARIRDQPQRSRITMCSNMVVMTIVVVTATP